MPNDFSKFEVDFTPAPGGTIVPDPYCGETKDGERDRLRDGKAVADLIKDGDGGSVVDEALLEDAEVEVLTEDTTACWPSWGDRISDGESEVLE